MVLSKLRRHFLQLIRGYSGYYFYRLSRIIRASVFQLGAAKKNAAYASLENRQFIKEVAVVAHIYYPGLIDEILRQPFFNNYKCDFFLSVKSEDQEIINRKMAGHKINAKIFCFENKGRDVLPFLKILPQLMAYEWICKVHSKKSPHMLDGELWGRDLIASLFSIKIPEILKTVDRQVQILAPYQSLLDIDLNMGRNFDSILNIFDQLKISPPSDFQIPFVAGTMFWVRPQSLKILCRETNAWDEYFSPEPCLVDGTYAHAFERIFYLLATNGKKSSGQMLPRASLLF